jgi:anti-sigma factor RsiW
MRSTKGAQHMTECPRGLLQLYVDGELSGEDAIALEAHLVECGACAREYEALRSVVDSVRGAKPLYDVPPGGRARVEALLNAGVRRSVRRRWVAIAALALTAAALVLTIQHTRRTQPFQKFTLFAINAHRDSLSGRMQLDLHSEDGPAVGAWLRGHLPFRITLPAYPVQPGAVKPYTLVGARILPFADHDLAYVAYRMEGRMISLLMSSSERLQPTGGRVLHSGPLKFHIVERDGLQLISWSDRGLSYALVSDVDAPAPESCVICHGADAERPSLDLTPRRQ